MASDPAHISTLLSLGLRRISVTPGPARAGQGGDRRWPPSDDARRRRAWSTGRRPIATYKRILRTYIDRRPSGTRQKIALTLGKHKSFVSQITNPSYASPVPAPHLNAIFEICNFSPEERKTFLGA